MRGLGVLPNIDPIELVSCHHHPHTVTVTNVCAVREAWIPCCSL